MLMVDRWFFNLEDIVKFIKNKIVLYLNLESSFKVIVIFKMSYWILEEKWFKWWFSDRFIELWNYLSFFVEVEF